MPARRLEPAMPPADTAALDARIGRLERRAARLGGLLVASLAWSLVLTAWLLAGVFQAATQARVTESLQSRLGDLERAR
jgi:hypothetical protein